MVYVSARALEEELRHLEEELAAARNLEHSTAERHAEEGSQETEAVLEARKIQAEHLEAEREGLVAELRRRTVAEAGWEHDAAGGAGPDGASVRSAGCGRAGKLREVRYQQTQRPPIGSASVSIRELRGREILGTSALRLSPKFP